MLGKECGTPQQRSLDTVHVIPKSTTCGEKASNPLIPFPLNKFTCIKINLNVTAKIRLGFFPSFFLSLRMKKNSLGLL